MPEQRNNPQKAKPKAKAQERLAALAEAKASEEDAGEETAEDNAKAEAGASDEGAGEEAAEEKVKVEANTSDDEAGQEKSEK